MPVAMNKLMEEGETNLLENQDNKKRRNSGSCIDTLKPVKSPTRLISKNKHSSLSSSETKELVSNEFLSPSYKPNNKAMNKPVSFNNLIGVGNGGDSNSRLSDFNNFGTNSATTGGIIGATVDAWEWEALTASQTFY